MVNITGIECSKAGRTTSWRGLSLSPLSSGGKVRAQAGYRQEATSFGVSSSEPYAMQPWQERLMFGGASDGCQQSPLPYKYIPS